MKSKHGKPQFKFLTGDVNWETYGGKWISQRFNNGEFDFWFVMTLFNWEDSVGEKEAKQVGFTYNVSVCVIAPEQFEDKEAALKSFGLQDDPEWKDLDYRMKVEIIDGYSGGAQVFSESGNSFRKLFKAARKAAFESEFLFGFAMDRAQNRIGSTGWDFLKGDILGGLKRYVESEKKDDPVKNVMLTIQGTPE